MNLILAIDAQGWVLIIGAIGTLITVAGVAITGVILAWKGNQKLDAAAARREQLADAIIDPAVTVLPPKTP